METRVCSRCKEEKDIYTNFHKNGCRAGVQRYMHICKACDRERGNQYAMESKYYMKDSRNFRNNEKRRASYLVNIKVRGGHIPSPKTLDCVDCGEVAREYHHEDYSKPFDVIPLCAKCHHNRHSASPTPPRL